MVTPSGRKAGDLIVAPHTPRPGWQSGRLLWTQSDRQATAGSPRPTTCVPSGSRARDGLRPKWRPRLSAPFPLSSQSTSLLLHLSRLSAWPPAGLLPSEQPLTSEAVMTAPQPSARPRVPPGLAVLRGLLDGRPCPNLRTSICLPYVCGFSGI